MIMYEMLRPAMSPLNEQGWLAHLPTRIRFLILEGHQGPERDYLMQPYAIFV